MKKKNKKLKRKSLNLYYRIFVLIIFAFVALNSGRFEDLKSLSYDLLNIKQERILSNVEKNIDRKSVV